MTTERTGGETPIINSFDEVKRAWREGQKDQYLTTKVWRKFFESRGIEVEIPFLNWNNAEIAKPIPTVTGAAIPGLMIPNFLEGTEKEILAQLVQAFPEMTELKLLRGVQFSTKPGWVKVENSHVSQNRNTTQAQVEEFMNANGLDGQRLSSYVLATAFSAETTDQHFDTATTTRLPGTFSSDGRMMGARMNQNGHIIPVTVNSPLLASPAQGARFEVSLP